MDKGVEEAEDPDGAGHVTHTSPHAHHSTGVVVGLQRRAVFALGQDDEGVENLVELAQVEEPTVEVETLGPHAAGLKTAGHAIAGSHVRSGALRGGIPASGGIVEVYGVAQASRSVWAAEALSRGSKAARSKGMGDAPLHNAHHAPEGPGRVNGEEDVVQHDKGEEGACLADAPRLLVAGLVVLVEQLGRDGIDGGDGQWDSGI